MLTRSWLRQITHTKYLFLSQIFGAIIALISSILCARYCGPEIFGFFALAILVLSVLLDLIDFGGASYYAREISAKRLDLFHFVEIMNRKTLSLLFLSPIIVLVLSMFRSFNIALTLLACYPFLWIRQNFLQQYLLAVGEIKKSIILQVSNRYFWLMSVPLIHLQASAEIVFILPIISGLIIENVLGLWLLKLYGVNRKTFFSSRSTGIGSTKHFGFLSVMSDLAMLDVLVMERVTDILTSASYIFTQRMRGPLLMIFQAFTSRLRPLATIGDRSQIVILFRKEFNLLLFGIFGILFSALFSRLFANDLLGNEYSDIETIMPVGILVALPSGLVTVGSGFITSAGRDKMVSRITAIWVPAMLITVGVLGKQFGGIGAILGLLLSYIVLASLILIISIRVWNSEFGHDSNPNK